MPTGNDLMIESMSSPCARLVNEQVELERAVIEAAAESVQNWRATNLFYRVNQEAKLVAAVDALVAAQTSRKQMDVQADWQRAIASDKPGESVPVLVIPCDPEMQPFDMTMAGGFVVSFSMKTNLKAGERIDFWGKSYIVSDREEKGGFVRYSLTPDSIPEVKYLGSTTEGAQFTVKAVDLLKSFYQEDYPGQQKEEFERFKIGEPTRTIIEDAGSPSTFVQDRLADMIEPEVTE